MQLPITYYSQQKKQFWRINHSDLPLLSRKVSGGTKLSRAEWFHLRVFCLQIQGFLGPQKKPPETNALDPSDFSQELQT